MDDRLKVITIAHPEQSSGELKIKKSSKLTDKVFCLSGSTLFCSGLPYLFCLDFTSLSVILRWCLGVVKELNAHLECCLSEISHPRHIKIFHTVTLYQHRVDQC